MTAFPSPDATPRERLDRNGLVVLEREECIALLRHATFGRIAITVDALPVILPVNFRLVDDSIVFTSNEGSKLDAATIGSVVAFEVDGIDPISHSGWSVVVTGVAGIVTDGIALERIRQANVPRWATGNGHRYVAIPISMISGRILVAGMAWSERPIRIVPQGHGFEIGFLAEVPLRGN